MREIQMRHLTLRARGKTKGVALRARKSFLMESLLASGGSIVGLCGRTYTRDIDLLKLVKHSDKLHGDSDVVRV